MARKMRRLNSMQYVQVREWVKNNSTLLRDFTITDIAKDCETAMGYLVSPSTITAIVDDDLKLDRPRAVRVIQPETIHLADGKDMDFICSEISQLRLQVLLLSNAIVSLNRRRPMNPEVRKFVENWSAGLTPPAPGEFDMAVARASG